MPQRVNPLLASSREVFIEDAQKFVSLMLDTGQWDALDKLTVQNWLRNFPPEAEYFAWKILRTLIYYSERDLEALLREAIIHRVIGRGVRLEHQIPNDFGRYPSFLRHELLRAVDRTLIVPLLDDDRPSESSLGVTRSALTALGFPTGAFVFPSNLTSVPPSSVDRVIIVDDNAGSGDQFEGFWHNYQLTPTVVPAQYLAQFREVNYVVLAATATGMKRLRADFPTVRFTAGQTLTAELGIFDNNSICWQSHEEREEALLILEKALAPFQIPVKGYQDLSHTLILHKNIPDWSLPVLWRGVRGEWAPLVTRKNSYA